MESSLRIAKFLVETGAFKSLQNPGLLTSGQLAVYYINAEKLCQDNGEWESFGDDSRGMIDHALAMMDEQPIFEEVIETLADWFHALNGCWYYGYKDLRQTAISGGERRDWIFSGPLAYFLDRPHISLHKDGRVNMLWREGDVEDYSKRRLDEFSVVHVVDLITEGSSIYRVEDRKEQGWVPMLRQRGARISDLAAIVTRLQGGEEMLAEKRVDVAPFVAIDEEFLSEHSANAERDIAYLKNPDEWCEAYLLASGALMLLDDFNPCGKNYARAVKFMGRYGGVLKQNSGCSDLQGGVRGKYGYDITSLLKCKDRF